MLIHVHSPHLAKCYHIRIKKCALSHLPSSDYWLASRYSKLVKILQFAVCMFVIWAISAFLTKFKWLIYEEWYTWFLVLFSPETIIFSSLISYVDLNESISNDWTFMKRQIKPPLKLIGRENTDNIILVERNVDMWGEALRSSNPVSLSSRTNMAIQTLQLQLKVITVITKVAKANQAIRIIQVVKSI